MSAQIRQLLDDENNKVYPVGVASAIYMDGGVYNLKQIWENMQDGNCKIEFPSDNQIKKTLATGDVVTTVFNVDDTITETTVNPEGKSVSVKTTKFNDDGSIDITIEE